MKKMNEIWVWWKKKFKQKDRYNPFPGDIP